jgi:hypothetical protein
MLNKTDVKERPEREILYKALEVDKIQKLVSKLYVKETSAYTKDGLEESIDWLYKNTNA